MDDYLNLLPYWDKLNENEKALTAENHTIRKFTKGSKIFGSESCLGMIYVLSGNIRVYILSEEGREITLFRFKKGDSCVLSSSCAINQINFDTYMEAETDCELLVVNSSTFKFLTDNNIYVRCYMYESLSERFSSVMWTMQQILFLRMDQRLATFLVSEYERTGRDEINMTHEQIAVYINSAREVVARMMKRFSTDGLVELKRGKVIISDVEGLKNLIREV